MANNPAILAKPVGFLRIIELLLCFICLGIISENLSPVMSPPDADDLKELAKKTTEEIKDHQQSMTYQNYIRQLFVGTALGGMALITAVVLIARILDENAFSFKELLLTGIGCLFILSAGALLIDGGKGILDPLGDIEDALEKHNPDWEDLDTPEVNNLKDVRSKGRMTVAAGALCIINALVYGVNTFFIFRSKSDK